MSAFSDASEEVLGKLTAAGVDATRNPAAGPPCVLIDPLTIPPGQGDHAAWVAEIPIRIVAAAPGDLAALDGLYERLQEVLLALHLRGPAIPELITLGGRELPAYTVTFSTSIPNPNC